jgi:hypothetical protein
MAIATAFQEKTFPRSHESEKVFIDDDFSPCSAQRHDIPDNPCVDDYDLINTFVEKEHCIRRK